MPWSKIDDQFYDHPKTIAAGPLGIALFTCALSYSARHLTDGFINAAQIKRILDVEDPVAIAEKLVEVGLFERAEGGYQIHDYLDYNPSAAQVKAEREAAKERMRAAREKKFPGSSPELPPNKTGSSDNPVPVPVPVPVPSPKESIGAGAPSENGNGHNGTRPLTERQKAQNELCERFSKLTGLEIPKHDTEKQKTSVATGWYNPIGAIYDKCGRDVEKAWSAISASVTRLKRNGLTIAEPRSIEKTATAICGERRNGNGSAAARATAEYR